jgi:putative DNA primase/helicase
LRQKIYSYLKDAKEKTTQGELKNFNPNKQKADQIVDALQAYCHHDHHPANGVIWLDERKAPNPQFIISFRNGLLNVQDWLLNPQTSLIPHTPLLLNVNSLSFDFNPGAQKPNEWLKFLNLLWPQDLESQQLLQEWAGLLLIPETRFQKILLMIGPPRSGKGTIGRILRDLLGDLNVVGPTLSSLGGEFGLQPLLNKILALISDARVNNRGANSIIIERLLSISGEDPLTVNRKFLSPLTVQLQARIVMMSNELPNMPDASGALAKRYLVLKMNKSWLGKEDSSLFLRLQEELPGILLWALEGLARLQQRKRFIQPVSSAPTIEELQAITSPIQAFVSERCEIKSSGYVVIRDLFEEWRSWCKEMGYHFTGNIQSFGKNLHAAYPEIEIIRPQEDNARERCYNGIVLIPDVRGRPRTNPESESSDIDHVSSTTKV